MPRFVILEHDHPKLHWDFMLESGPTLRAWRLESPPRAGETTDAIASFDHRLEYLAFEGPISGDRGRVVRWDQGVFAWEFQTADLVVVRLEGSRLRGVLRLERVAGNSWRGHYLDSTIRS